jgi:hypothetical protein
VPRSRISRSYISSPPCSSIACSGTDLEFLVSSVGGVNKLIYTKDLNYCNNLKTRVTLGEEAYLTVLVTVSYFLLSDKMAGLLKKIHKTRSKL